MPSLPCTFSVLLFFWLLIQDSGSSGSPELKLASDGDGIEEQLESGDDDNSKF